MSDEPLFAEAKGPRADAAQCDYLEGLDRWEEGRAWGVHYGARGGCRCLHRGGWKRRKLVDGRGPSRRAGVSMRSFVADGQEMVPPVTKYDRKSARGRNTRPLMVGHVLIQLLGRHHRSISH